MTFATSNLKKHCSFVALKLVPSFSIRKIFLPAGWNECIIFQDATASNKNASKLNEELEVNLSIFLAHSNQM